MKHTNSINKPFWQNSLILILLFSVIGIITGYFGFVEEKYTCGSSIYTTIQLFVLHHSFKEPAGWLLLISRWSILIVIILLSKDALSILFREQLKFLKIKFFYKNHIIFCGLTEQSLQLANRYPNKQRIFIDNDTDNPLHRSLRDSNAKLIIGNPSSRSILKLVNIHKAKEVFVFTANDKKNVDIAQVISSVLENQSRKDALRCFISITDRELKPLLEETTLFKHKTKNFDGILFNINEMGIKYGICMNIDKILPAKMETAPEILLVGLTEKTEVVLLNLAHCLTMQRATFKFTINENDTEKIRFFEKQCKKLHLTDFAEIKISNNNLEKICAEKTFDSIFVCTENQIDAVKQAVEIHYVLGKNAPNIILFYDDTDFNSVLKNELEIKKIFTINLFGQIADYVFDLDSEDGIKIEDKAKKAHYFWNEIYKMNTEWDEQSGHFKQSNRNQILDNYLRAYIARGKKFEDLKNSLTSFSDNEKETLAMMEHRRWMIEKYDNGWVYDKKRDNNFKRHNALHHWEQISETDKRKDEDAINLMINFINNQNK